MSHFSTLENILRDFRTGLRSILRTPAVSLILIFTLALGIGANTAIFSVVYTVLLKPPPYPSGERLVQIWESSAGQNIPVSWTNFEQWRQTPGVSGPSQNHTFHNLATAEVRDLTLTGRGNAAITHAGIVSADFFTLTGWKPLTGRLFSPTDDLPSAAPSVIITSEFWMRTLSADTSLLGASLTLDGKPYQIIGILPPGVSYFNEPVDYYLPAGPRNSRPDIKNAHDRMVLIGLLKPGVTTSAARADLNAIMRSTNPGGPEADHRAAVEWLAGSGREEIRKSLYVLWAAVGLVLLIACANVGSLLLVRTAARTRELAIRAAIGAGRARLTQQLLIENILLGTFGAALGLLFAAASLRLLLAFSPPDIPRLADTSLNLPILGFTAAVTLVTILIAGLAPVFAARRLDLTNALRAGSPSIGTGKAGQTFRNGMVVGQIAITLVLTYACGLLLQSLALAQKVNPGFDAAKVLALEFQLPPNLYRTDTAKQLLLTRLNENLQLIRGVASVGLVDCPPPTGGCARGWYSIPDLPAPAKADVPLALLTRVDSGYFRTMKIPSIAGQALTRRDVIVNEQLARHWWPSSPQSAVGHAVKFGGPYLEGPTFRIVGVVGNVNQSGLDVAPMPEIYAPFSEPVAFMAMIRTKGEPTRLIPTIRRQLTAIDPNVPIRSLKPLERSMDATLLRRRFSTWLLTIFAALALTLSAIGIYGNLNYWVSLKRREIAIRFSLGAQRGAILGWVSMNITRLLIAGIIIGSMAAWGTSDWLSSLVFGISPQSPATWIIAALVIPAIATLAALRPLYRATNADVDRNFLAE